MGYGRVGRGLGYGIGFGGMGYGRGYGRGRGRGKGKFSGYTCIKFIFFAFNVLFWLLGCAILGIGIWLHISKGNYASIAPTISFLSATALCITAGVVVLVVGFFGCCGAIMENQCMLLTYFLLVVVIFVLEIVVGILAFVYREEVETVVKKELSKGLRDKYPSPDINDEQGLKNAWDHIQRKLKCCGVSNYTDWYQIAAWPEKDWVPDSCCDFETPGCGTTYQPNIWYHRGCLNELKFVVKQNLYIVGVVGITVGVLQIINLVCVMVLFCHLNNKLYYDDWH